MTHANSCTTETILAKLRVLLAPQGTITYSTGADLIAKYYQQRYQSLDYPTCYQQWKKSLEDIPKAKVIILGIPSDTGAGFARASFQGPVAIRNRLLEADFYPTLDQLQVVDIGDIYCNPALIHDDHYTPSLIAKIRESRLNRLKNIDPEAHETALEWKDFPVSPHSAYQEALRLLRQLLPNLKYVALGGDHSLSRIPVYDLTTHLENPNLDLGVFHIDAHTDLLEHRDGIPYSFATWAYHANEMIGLQKRMVQIGVRASGQPAEFWEKHYDLTQIRPHHLGENPDPEAWADKITNIFRQAGVKRLFVSNDIDGTDPQFAASTGTMEPDGLHPHFVYTVTKKLSQRFELMAADLAEVAPPLKLHFHNEPAKTIETSCSYFVGFLEGLLKQDIEHPFDVMKLL